MKKKSPNVAFLLSFFLPGAGLWYSGKWGWGFANLFVVLAIGMACAFLLPENLFDDYIRYVGYGCAGGSAALANTVAKQLQAKLPTDGKP